MIELEDWQKMCTFYHPYYNISTYLIGDESKEILIGITDTEAFNNYLIANFGEAPRIPDSVQIINNLAFQNIANLQSITLPKELKIIGDAAFRNTGLRNVDFSNCQNLFSIDKFAFYNCNFNEVIDLSECDKLRLIGQYAFGLNNLCYVQLPCEDYKISIGVGAFSKRNGGNAKQVVRSGDMEQVRLF